MKKRICLLQIVLFCLLSGTLVPSFVTGQTTLTYTLTGSVQTFTVPNCVTSLSLNASGARGGSNAGGLLGGLGGSAFGVLTVTPGDVLYIYVGGSNGYNGGAATGTSGCSSALGGIGGGASDVRLNGTALAN